MPVINSFKKLNDNLIEAMQIMAGLLDESGYYDGRNKLYVRSADKQLLEKAKSKIYAGTIIQRGKKWYYEIQGKDGTKATIRNIGPLMQNKEKLDKWISLCPDVMVEPPVFVSKRELKKAELRDKKERSKRYVEIDGISYESTRQTRTWHYTQNNVLYLETSQGSPYLVLTGTKEVLQDLKWDNYMLWSPFIEWTSDDKIYNAVEVKNIREILRFLTKLGHCANNLVPRSWIKYLVDYCSFLPKEAFLTPYVDSMCKACNYDI
jgi:hypothetical protein